MNIEWLNFLIRDKQSTFVQELEIIFCSFKGVN